ncbi:unnamed protein product [Brachionus calyciflorus]|uniref:Uncharacterized protein n=1 Tax=Brachionus calyciflorus TaxID=104777 RepID=A0A814E8K8_9BILA|nr:unnamed protein product [Brachionus calyciflorus]
MNVEQDKKSDKNLLFDYFKYEKIKPTTYLLDVLGDDIHVDSNAEWRKLGKCIVKYLFANNKKAVLVSTSDLNYLISDSTPSQLIISQNTISFTEENRVYKVTVIDPDKT